jgi:hypothetical protein
MAADPPHDVFISFSSLDSADAALLCERLEKEGIICWISTRDVKPGENYQAAIVNAIKTAKIVVLAFSANANASPEVSKELSLASAFKVTVIPVRMTEAVPQGAFLYELSTRQWIDAFNKWDSALELLVSTAKRICARLLTRGTSCRGKASRRKTSSGRSGTVEGDAADTRGGAGGSAKRLGLLRRPDCPRPGKEGCERRGIAQRFPRATSLRSSHGRGTQGLPTTAQGAI